MAKKKNKLQLYGISITAGLLGFIALYFLLVSSHSYMQDWIDENQLLVFIISLIAVIIFLTTGILSIRRVLKKGKSYF